MGDPHGKTHQTRDCEQELRDTVLENLPIGVVLVSPLTGDVELSNAKVLELWGHTRPPQSIGDLPLWHLDGSEVRLERHPVTRALFSDSAVEPHRYRIHRELDNLGPIDVEVRVNPIHDQDDQTTGALMTITSANSASSSFSSASGMIDRSAFTDRLTSLLSTAKYSQDAAIFYIDLDGFGGVDASYGAAAAESTLAEVGDRLLRSVRKGDLVGRLGSDQFAVLTFPVDDRAEVESIATRLVEIISAPVQVRSGSIRISASVGIARFGCGEGAEPVDVLRRAELAMYRAKRSDASRWVLEDPGDEHPHTPAVSLSDEIHRALDTEQFVILYRPVIDLSTGRVCEVDIAMFWDHPEEGLLDDRQIRQRAWKAGLLHAISERAAELAERDRDLLIESLGSGRNMLKSRLHWIEYLREKRVIEQVLEIARQVDGSPIRVRMDISGRLDPDDEIVIARLRQLHEAGIAFGLADVGDINGDLSLISRLPISAMTVSKQLVHASQVDPASGLVARAMVAVARELEIPIRADGVSRQQDLDHVRRLGFDRAIGTHFSRPLTAVELIDFQLDRVFRTS